MFRSRSLGAARYPGTLWTDNRTVQPFWRILDQEGLPGIARGGGILRGILLVNLNGINRHHRVAIPSVRRAWLLQFRAVTADLALPAISPGYFNAQHLLASLPVTVCNKSVGSPRTQHNAAIDAAASNRLCSTLA